ncbi:17775_t:CDS:10 [Acaulospora morrowiae]|uniref:acireductone dioxygenase (Fe(2+)-requiring) n=1 Tax=Acaulospora morrowiae TaxID=94023 RepID=A0A9N9GHB8_9GLOM|nr:17775_t:CDS:10 [Acaulospora morrowiae]
MNPSGIHVHFDLTLLSYSFVERRVEPVRKAVPKSIGIGGYEYLDDEEQAMLRRALALSLERNDNDSEDSSQQTFSLERKDNDPEGESQRTLSLSLERKDSYINDVPQQTLSLSLRRGINNPEEVGPIPRFMPFGAPFSESPQTTFYHDLNNKSEQWVKQRQTFNEKRCFRYLLEDLCSYLYFLIKAAFFLILLMILMSVIMGIIQFVMIFRSDINKEFEIIASEIHHQAQKCTINYVTNRCAPETRAPFLEENCTKWEKCMNRDPYNSIKTTEVHEQVPFSPVTPEELANYGVLYWRIEGENSIEKIDEIAKERNYSSRDEQVGNVLSRVESHFQELNTFMKMKKFGIYWMDLASLTFAVKLDNNQHDHYGIKFEFYSLNDIQTTDSRDRWIRIDVEKGDMLILPAGIYHRFGLDDKECIKAMRLFKEKPKWTPINRPADENPSRLEYLKSLKRVY